MFLKGTLMRAALCRMLTIDIGIIFLAILRRVGKSNIDALALNMHDGIKRRRRKIVRKKVFKTIAADDSSPVVENCKTCVEVRIVTEHELYEFSVEAVVLKERGVGGKEDVGAIFFLRVGINIVD